MFLFACCVAIFDHLAFIACVEIATLLATCSTICCRTVCSRCHGACLVSFNVGSLVEVVLSLRSCFDGLFVGGPTSVYHLLVYFTPFDRDIHTHPYQYHLLSYQYHPIINSNKSSRARRQLLVQFYNRESD